VSDPVDPEASVLGQLPRSRPTVRSPRRADASREDSKPTDPGPDQDPAGGPVRAPGLEAVAQAGFSAAGDVASIGVRIAAEAVAMLRGAIERR